MGYPVTGTVEVTGAPNPLLYDLVEQALTDPCNKREELLKGLSGHPIDAGHFCVNSWVFSPDFSHVLLVQHPKFGWTIPGGHVDPGEHPLDAVRRELYEETGVKAEPALEAPVALVVAPVHKTKEHPKHVHYTLSYSFYAPLDAQLIAEDGQPVEWFPLDEELPEGYFGDNWHAYRQVAILKEQTIVH